MLRARPCGYLPDIEFRNLNHHCKEPHCGRHDETVSVLIPIIGNVKRLHDDIL